MAFLEPDVVETQRDFHRSKEESYKKRRCLLCMRRDLSPLAPPPPPLWQFTSKGVGWALQTARLTQNEPRICFITVWFCPLCPSLPPLLPFKQISVFSGPQHTKTASSNDECRALFPLFSLCHLAQCSSVRHYCSQIKTIYDKMIPADYWHWQLYEN